MQWIILIILLLIFFPMIFSFLLMIVVEAGIYIAIFGGVALIVALIVRIFNKE